MMRAAATAISERRRQPTPTKGRPLNVSGVLVLVREGAAFGFRGCFIPNRKGDFSPTQGAQTLHDTSRRTRRDVYQFHRNA